MGSGRRLSGARFTVNLRLQELEIGSAGKPSRLRAHNINTPRKRISKPESKKACELYKALDKHFVSGNK